MKKQTKEKILRITEHSKGLKMESMYSLNTSIEENKFCQKMITSKKQNVICQKCFGDRMEKMYKGFSENVKINLELLSSRILEDKELISTFNINYFRLHSTGEILNDIHLINFINIARKNPNTNFTLWSKQASIVEETFNMLPYGLPKNLMLIYSSPDINKECKKIPRYFSKVFTAFTKDFIKKNNVKINCGTKKCKDCLICYSHKSKVKYIREILK